MGKKKMSRIANLRSVAEKIQKMSLISSTLGRLSHKSVPGDVKEGHFAVIAGAGAAGDEPKRFVVPLRCLTHPSFVRLLEQAAEEYGFDHHGALTLPCHPTELQTILAAAATDDQWHHSTSSSLKWGSSSGTMVQSY